MASYLYLHLENFEQLILFVFNRNDKLSWRSAWMIFSLMPNNDVRIQPHLKQLIDYLPNAGESLQRELLKIISKMEISEEYEAFLVNHCISIWEQVNKSPSVRYHALKTVLRLTKKYPELKSEIEYLIQEHYVETLSPAIRKMLIKEITNLK